MYSQEYANYIINCQLDEIHHLLANKIIDLVPKNGKLKMTPIQISSKLNVSEEKVLEIIEVMSLHKNPLIKQENNIYIFDYPQKDIDYVKHFRRALSNIGMNNKDFLEE